MNLTTFIAQTSPVTNQMHHTWDLTWLYLIPLPLIAVLAVRAGMRQRKQVGPHKTYNAARMNQSHLSQEQERLKQWRKFVRDTGDSPVGGKTPEQAIADQEALVRSLLVVQSDLHSKLPEGGRGPYEQDQGR